MDAIVEAVREVVLRWSAVGFVGEVLAPPVVLL